MTQADIYLDTKTSVRVEEFGTSIFDRMKAEVMGAHSSLVDNIERFQARRREEPVYFLDETQAIPVITEDMLLVSGEVIEEGKPRHVKPKKTRFGKLRTKARAWRYELRMYLYGKGYIA